VSSVPARNVAGYNTRIFTPEETADLVAKIRASAANWIWVGLGTPKQQQFIRDAKAELPGVVFLSVGFAFDVNAGTKRDAPLWMQRIGLTWLFRLCSEPRRLFGRYLKWNSLFVWYLLTDGQRRMKDEG